MLIILGIVVLVHHQTTSECNIFIHRPKINKTSADVDVGQIYSATL